MGDVKAESENQSAEVIQFRGVKDPGKASEKKWGKAVMAIGFCIVPSLLIRAQSRLKINAAQLAVLIQLADYWWHKERSPFPGKKAIAERLGISPRHVQRHMANLEKLGLLKRIERLGSHRGKLTNEYDLSGLVKRLQELAPEFKAVEEEVKKQRRAITRPGLKIRKPQGA